MKKERIDTVLGNLLRYGVIVATFVVLTGGCLFLYNYGHEIPKYGVFEANTVSLRFLTDIFSSAFSGYSTGIIQLGILLIIAVPILRVIFCVVIYSVIEDWLYVGISSFILIVLLYSLLI